MTTIRESTAALFNALKLLLPGLPERAQKLTLTLQAGKAPLVECTYFPEVDGDAPAPVKPITGKYALTPIGGPGSSCGCFKGPASGSGVKDTQAP